jgi:hypothetical protein
MSREPLLHPWARAYLRLGYGCESNWPAAWLKQLEGTAMIVPIEEHAIDHSLMNARESLRIMFLQLIPLYFHDISPERVHEMATTFADRLAPTAVEQAKIRAAAEKACVALVTEPEISEKLNNVLIDLQVALYGEY